MHKQGDIVLIPVPFSDLTNRKQRPVLIISNNHYNEFTEDIVVAAITSQLKGLDYSIKIDSKDLSFGRVENNIGHKSRQGLYTLKKYSFKEIWSSKLRYIRSCSY